MNRYILALLLISPWATAGDSESNWIRDGWRADFGSGVCYLWQTYHDSDTPIVGITNVGFVKILPLAKSGSDDDYPPLASMFLDAGVATGELVFTIGPPDKNSYLVPDVLAVEIVVGGYPAEKLTGTMLDLKHEWSEFVIREPQSQLLLDRIEGGEPIAFEVSGSDENIEFIYAEEPDIDFQIRRAQFDACVRTIGSQRQLVESSGRLQK